MAAWLSDMVNVIHSCKSDRVMDSKENVKRFHKVFNIVNNVLSAFGLSFIQRNGSGIYQVSRIKLLYGLLIAFFILFVFHQQITHFYPRGLDNVILIILFLYMAVVGTLMAILMVATAACNASSLTKLLNNPEYKELFNLEAYDFVKFHTTRQFLFSSSVLIVCYVSDFVAEGDYSLKTAIKIMMFFFFPMYNAFCLSEFFSYHFWLQRWYWHINSGLKKLLNDEWWEKQEAHVLGVMEMARCVQFANRNLSFESHVIDTEKLRTTEIIRLRRLYHKTYSFGRHLDKLYSFRNVLLLVHHCVLETVYTYWGLRHTLEDLGVPITAILNFYKAATMSFVSVVTMVWPCTITKIQASQTEHLVQDLLAKETGGQTLVEAEIFSLQMLQERYHFSPHGFFEMDTKLLLSFLASVASYLLILVQYHMVYIALKATKNSQIDMANTTTSAI